MAQIKPYKKQDGTINYMFDYYVGINPKTGKKQKTTRRGFETKEEASLALAELSLLVATEQYLPRKYKTFNDVYTLWLNKYRGIVKESTYAGTLSIFKNNILPYFQEIEVQNITTVYCQEIVNKWYKIHPKRFKRYIYYFNAVMNHANYLELIFKNPMEFVQLPHNNIGLNQYKEFDNFYSKDELLEFLNFTKNNFEHQRFIFFHLLAFTGIRRGEALSLTWNDINFEEKYLHVSKTLTKGENGRFLIHPPKTKASFRKIFLDNQTLNYLQTWKEIQKETLNLSFDNPKQLLFPNHKNSFLEPNIPREWLQTIARHYKKKTTKDLKIITIHGFRHTHASLLYLSGINLKEAQERLGHSNVKTTLNVYTHLSDKQREQTVDKLIEFMNLD
ncbi:site-specific integrase [Enterococcus faecium]|uniref:site-specific integrase n=2 Tax=Enterococcus TaxID=1350 RepID=UPI000CF351B8|nr:site-specific integrase [Enterococcus faecium]EGP5127921.1 site-specific integrase [Enterococcus faecium]EGP5495114.1 site-specific integrase [Enterococcus faecium]EME3542982.1 tyrosine-type recombinase/integrase [Enterococcus faecium]MDQ8290426.1 site-specific integrase [Enterococcus faecium]PQG44198.1 site-specific integrase [Enterococcus faecium]